MGGRVHSLDLFMFGALNGILRTVLLSPQLQECYCGENAPFTVSVLNHGFRVALQVAGSPV